jgi:hypothetical protein
LSRAGSRHLGLQNRGVNIRWFRKRGMLWSELTATVEKKIDSLPLPCLLVIQLGSNDLGKASSYDLIQDIKSRAARYTCNRHHNTSSVSEMLNTMNWQTLQERRLRTRLIMFHKVITENIAIPTQNILLQSQSTTRSSWKDSYRQIQCNKDSYKCSFFCQTIKDWNILSPDITKNTTTEPFKGAFTHEGACTDLTELICRTLVMRFSITTFKEL